MSAIPSHPRALAAVLLLAALGPAPGALAEELRLEPGRAPGDAYVLSLRATTRTEAEALTSEGRSFREEVQIEYRATVTVLEVDAQGRPRRERHADVRMTFERPDGRGSLFAEEVGYEVRREPGGELRILAGGERVDPRIEEVVAPLLERQLGHTGLPALVDPGRAVEVGESWELDPARARSFLRERGVRVLEPAGPATASLERDAADGGLVIAYRVPVGWFELPEMPEGVRASESEATLEGRLQLAEEPGSGLREHSSTLDLRLHGSVSRPGSGRPLAWSLRRRQDSQQRVHELESAPASASEDLAESR